MSNSSPNHLVASPAEKKKLRAARIKVGEVHLHSVKELQDILNASRIRAMELFALSEFQSLPSIGVRFAHDLITMGYYSLGDLKGKDGAKLTDKFERQSGVWIDPCVEDQFRLIVHYANNPGVHKDWWEFTPVRKAFREKFGYPSSRPKDPWFEQPKYQTASNIQASNEETKKDLHKKLKLAIQFMKKNFSNKITLKHLANVSHLSQYHFIRCFKSAYEQTPFQYLTHIRLKHASKLLRETKLTVGEVTLRSGFENESSFIRLFKRAFKRTPGKLKNSLLN